MQTQTSALRFKLEAAKALTLFFLDPWRLTERAADRNERDCRAARVKGYCYGVGRPLNASVRRPQAPGSIVAVCSFVIIDLQVVLIPSGHVPLRSWRSGRVVSRCRKRWPVEASASFVDVFFGSRLLCCRGFCSGVREGCSLAEPPPRGWRTACCVAGHRIPSGSSGGCLSLWSLAPIGWFVADAAWLCAGRSTGAITFRAALAGPLGVAECSAATRGALPNRPAFFSAVRTVSVGNGAAGSVQ
jgi:hypothetical protein